MRANELAPIAALALMPWVAACSDDESADGGDGGQAGATGAAGAAGSGGVSGGSGSGGSAGTPPTTFGGDRPVELIVPDGYDPDIATPLLILLHGYTSTGAGHNAYFRMESAANDRGFLYAFPDGTVDPAGNGFWNATPGCCDVFKAAPDDSAYLRQLVEDIKASYNVDPKRVHFVGHSNGGFMSYRMACDHADVVASVASLAGATFTDAADCNASEPVHVLQIHGTMDTVIDYAGGKYLLFDPHPSAVETVEQWATLAGCSLMPDDTAAPLDLDSSLPGDETAISRYETGCDPRGSAELWTIAEGSHSPPLTDAFSSAVLDFLLAHPKP